MQKQAWKKMKKTAITLSLAMFVTYAGGAYTPKAEAASKAPTLSDTSISLKKGQTKKITIKTSKKEKIKKTTWKVNNKKLKVVKKTKKSIVVKALKTGKVTISVKIKTNKKIYNKKVKVTVPVKKSTPKPIKTKQPNKTTEPVKTDAPGNVTPKPDNPDNPSQTDAPDITEAPVNTEPPKDTVKPSETDKPANTGAPSAEPLPILPEVPEELIEGTLAQKSSWNDGVISNLSGILSGKKVRFTIKVREKGVNSPSGKMKITCNYDTSYPTLAEFDISTEWQTITFEHRFNNFTNQYACMYFDDGNGSTPADLNMYYRDLIIDVIDQGDELGGTALTPTNWHKGTLTSLRNSSINSAEPNKAYENKSAHISFKLRAKGEIPDGSTCYIKANGISPERVIEDIPLTTDWYSVEADCNFGKATDNWPGLFFDGEDITSDMELFIKDVSITITGAAPTPTPAPPTETINVDINKSVTFAPGTAAWTNMKNTTLDSPVEIKSTDTVKAKIKVTFEGEATELSTNPMQVLLFTNADDNWNSRCFATNNVVSGVVTEMVRGANDTGDKSVAGFFVQTQNTLPDEGKNIVVTFEKLIIERVIGSDTPSGTAAPGAPTVSPGPTATPAPTATPFESYELKGASQYQQIGLVTYTVGSDIPNAFHIEYTATENAGVNLTISANGKECNYGCGTARTKDCDITVSQWGGNPIGSLSTGDTVTIKAVASGTNELDSFEFTEITPSNDDGNLTAVDLTGIDPYVFAGTGGNFTMVMKTTKTIAPDITGKTLADYSKVVIECEESGSAQLTYSLMDKDDSGNTDAFVVYNQSPGTITINLNETNFNPPGTYQQKYADINAAKALDVSNVCLKVTAPTAGYKGKIVIKSVTLVE